VTKSFRALVIGVLTIAGAASPVGPVGAVPFLEWQPPDRWTQPALAGGTAGDPTYDLHFSGTPSAQDFYLDTLGYDANNTQLPGNRWLWPHGTGDYLGWHFAGFVSPVPEPGTLLLLGAAMVAIGAWGRKRLKERHS
jgi:hypothetical protein